MIVYRRKRLGVFFIYRKEEADREGIEYKYWKECKEGEYALTDDGFVGMVLRVNVNRIGKIFNTVWGRYFLKDRSYDRDRMTYADKKGSPNVANKNGLDGFVMKTNGRLSAKEFAYVYSRMLVSGKKINYSELAERFFGEYKRPKVVLKRRLKSELFMDAVNKEVMKLLSKHGIDEEYIVKEGFMAAIDIAKEAKDGTLLLKSAIELAKLAGMYPDKKVTTNQISIRETRDIGGMIEKESMELTQVKSEREISQ